LTLCRKDIVAPPPPNPPGSRRRSRRDPPTIDLKPNPAHEAARPEEGRETAPASDVSDAAGLPSDAGATGATEPEPRAAESETASVPAEDQRSAAATGARDEPPFVGPPPDLDERLIETAESREAARGPERGAPDSPEAPTMLGGHEPGNLDEKRPIEPERRRPSGLGALLGASALGGLIGAGLAYGAATVWRQPSSRVETRLAQIEERLGALPTRENLSGLERRIAALEPEQRALAERLTRVQALADAASKRAEDALNRPLPTAGAAPPAAAPGADTLADINQRLATLETELRSQAQAIEAAKALDGRIAEQSQRLAAFESRAAEQAQQLAATRQQLTQQVAPLASQLQQVTQQLAQQRERLAAGERQLTELRPEAMQAGVRVVASDRVGDALRDGSPYPSALAALQRLNVDPARLRPLEPFAASGAPTPAVLAQEFKPLGQKIIAEARGPTSDWSDKLWRMAEGIVTVRPMGETGSTATPALVARIENALDRGAVGEAAAAWDALPEPARRLSEDWARKLKARAAAEDAARSISTEALAALDVATR
jgi:hypothetical protein